MRIRKNFMNIRWLMAASVMTVAALHGNADDRAMFVMAGDVASVALINSDDEMEWEQVIEFNTDGRIAAVDGVVPVIDRDRLGRPVTVTLTAEDEDGGEVSVTTRLTYHGDTFMVATAETVDGSEEGSWCYTYSYDKSTGRTLQRVYSSMGESETFVYDYTVTDTYGNWTVRTETSDGAEFPLTQRRRIEFR